MQPPVRIYALTLATLMVFAFALGWGRSAQMQAAQAAAAARELMAPGEIPVSAAPYGQSAQAGDKPKPAGEAANPAQSTPPSGTTHVVRQGETLSAISRLYGVAVESIRTANGLKSDQIRVGQTLTIPGAEPVRKHTVQEGDSFWELASRYGVPLEALLAANKDVEPGHLSIGKVLVIPPSTSAVRPVSAAAGSGVKEALKGLFAWPSTAVLSSEYGPRWGRNHNGIDLAANHGDPIKAARDGEVLLAGTVDGYGETVVLQHADGTRTLYAHASKLLVRSRQKVKQGDVIALVGSTGRSTGPHLHFEIIVDDRPVNPLSYLPPR